MTDELSATAKQTRRSVTIMNKQELRTSIINKINSAKRVYVYNGFTEFYFKTSKADLLYHFRKTYKSTNYVGNQLHLLEWLKDFNDRCSICDNGDLNFD